jgi:hypothetical protein
MKRGGEKMRNYFILLMAIFAAPGMAISGYASAQLDLVKNEAVKVEIVSIAGNYVSRAFAYKDGDEVVIDGWAKRRNTSSSSKGHVDIAVFGPKGELIEQVSAHYMPSIIPRKGRRASVFEVRLPGIPDRSTVRIAYHGSIRDRGHNTFDCGSNRALFK